MKKKLLFVITQFFKGGAEVALLNLLKSLDPEQYDVDFLIFDQIKVAGAVSLIDQIPPWVHVCNAAESEGHIALLKKLLFKFYRKFTKKQLFRMSAYRFIDGKSYDWAFSYGEWMAPQFVAEQVSASHKAVWIHTDIDKAPYVDDKVLFGYDDAYDKYIYVSKLSQQSAESKYPFLRGRGAVVHNMCDDTAIREQALEDALHWPETKLPVLVTVANIRSEKNHLRQVEAMQILRNRGVDFLWINLGSAADPFLKAKLDAQIDRAGLNDVFLLLSAQANPYPYIKRATAVCVLSDFESWSIVITEAKLLGTPVIATKTSGALEQITDNKNGFLCDFTPESIADSIETLLMDDEVQKKMRKHLMGFATQDGTVAEFEKTLGEEASACLTKKNFKRLLYVIDNVNYVSGVQKITAEQIRLLSDLSDISIFSLEPPTNETRALFFGATFLNAAGLDKLAILSVPFKQALKSSAYTIKQKWMRIRYMLAVRKNRGDLFMGNYMDEILRDSFEKFDVICVVSEASRLRGFISKLQHPRKVQWIHTDYKLWSEYSEWTRMICTNDMQIYSNFDAIVTLSNRSQMGFVEKFPALLDRVHVIHHIMNDAEIKLKAQSPCPQWVEDGLFSFVTVGRLDGEKAYDRLLLLCRKLLDDGFRFRWYIIGDGPQKDTLQKLIDRLQLRDHVWFVGALENPYPLMIHGDVFALLSHYEGLPVTVFESLILGVPVIAVDVGGIAEQLQDGQYGILVKNDFNNIYNVLKKTLYGEGLGKIRRAVKSYQYDNAAKLQQIKDVFKLS